MEKEYALDEIYNYIFNGLGGFRSFCTSIGEKDSYFKHYEFECEHFLKNMESLRKKNIEKNQYVTPQIIKTKVRKDGIAYITNLILDVDSHKVEVSEDVLRYLARFINRVKTYTLCTYSGRGIHFWYNIRPVKYTPESKVKYDYCVNQLAKLLNVIIGMYPMFSSLTVDKGTSKRMNGLMRLPGSYNAKAEKWTKYEFNPIRYTLDELAAGLGYSSSFNQQENIATRQSLSISAPIPSGIPISGVQIKKGTEEKELSFMEQVIKRDSGKSIIQESGRIKKGHISERTSFMGQLQKRVLLIEKVVHDRGARNRERGIIDPIELRHNTLLVYYNSLVGLLELRAECKEKMEARKEAERRTRELNESFINPYSEEELEVLIGSVNKVKGIKTGGNSYAFTNAQIIEILGLTLQEQEIYDFHEAIGEAEEFDYSKMRPNRTRNEQREKRKQEKEAKRKQEKEAKRELLLSLYRQGYTKGELVAEIGFSMSTISKIIKESGLSDSDNPIRIQQMKHKGYTQAEATKRLGLGIATVKRYW